MFKRFSAKTSIFLLIATILTTWIVYAENLWWQILGDNVAFMDGKVGIGTTSPEAALHIDGGEHILLANKWAIQAHDTNGTNVSLLSLWGDDVYVGVAGASNVSKDTIFRTNRDFIFRGNDVNQRPQVHIDSVSGNTTIWNTPGNEKLTVDGNILANSGSDICIDTDADGIAGIDDVCLSNLGKNTNEPTHISSVFQTRNTSSAIAATQLADGSIVRIWDLLYRVNKSATGIKSVTKDLWVDGLVPAGEINLRHFGNVHTLDDAPVWNNAINWANQSLLSSIVINIDTDTQVLSGTSYSIKRHNLFFVFEKSVKVKVASWILFSWWNGWTKDSWTVWTGWGIIGAYFHSDNPDKSQVIVRVNGHSGLIIQDIYSRNITSLLNLWTPGAGNPRAGWTHVSGWHGTTANIPGSSVIRARHGQGLFLRNINLSVDWLAWFQFDRTPQPISHTTFLKMGEGMWDTVVASNVVTVQYGIGTHLQPHTSKVVSNMRFSNYYHDISHTNGFLIDTSVWGIVAGVEVIGWYFTALNGNAVESRGKGGIKNVNFHGTLARMSGKNNWHLNGDNQNIGLYGCTGSAANRLSSNTGTNKHGLAILKWWVKVIGGEFWEDGRIYTWIVWFQADYGVGVAPNLSNVQIKDVVSRGVLWGYSIPKNTRSVRAVSINSNITADKVRPEYAEANILTNIDSGVQQRWDQAYITEIRVAGTWINQIRKNWALAYTNSWILTIEPGDTWTIMYNDPSKVTVTQQARR